MNLIKQIVKPGEYGTQTIRMIVKSNERGAQGEQGPKGDPATIEAGAAYSVPATSGPAVINVGTDNNAKFDFYIPRGEVEWSDIDGNIHDQAELEPYLEKVDTALQPDDIDYTVMQDLSVSANGSTSVLQLDADKVNLKSGETTTKNIPLTVASHEKAGVMNSATFDAVATNSSNINTIMNGMVAIPGLSSSPTQSELTTAWEGATGLTELVNHAQILDVDNDKYWTYYKNTETWYAGSADIQVSVSTFTNSSEGTILGSTTVGQVYAESNGTGSVNGWDALSAQVDNNTANKLGTAKLTSSDGIAKTTTGSGADTTVNLGISDGGVTTAKIADANVTTAKFSQYAVNVSIKTATNLSPAEDTPTGWRNLLNKSGMFVTRYSLLSQFAHQPSQYGELITVNNGTDIIQFWLQYNNPARYRYGNASGWKNGTQDGVWDVLIDHRTIGKYAPMLTFQSANSTSIPSGADLHNNTYCQPGNYCCRNNTIAQTVLHSPTTGAFRMVVLNTLNSGTTVSPTSGTYYLLRFLINYQGTIYMQYVANSNSAWSFGTWKKVIDSSQSGTVTTGMLANNAITTAKIADKTITTAKYADGSIGNTALATNIITTDRIVNKAVTADKLAWGAFGYAYKAISSPTSWTPSSTAKVYPSGWNFSFTAVSGGTYEVKCHSSLLGVINSPTPTTETGLGIELVSGGTLKVATADDTICYARGQTAKAIIQATSTTVQVKAYVVSTANKTVSMGAGLITVKRVA